MLLDFHSALAEFQDYGLQPSGGNPQYRSGLSRAGKWRGGGSGHGPEEATGPKVPVQHCYRGHPGRGREHGITGHRGQVSDRVSVAIEWSYVRQLAFNNFSQHNEVFTERNDRALNYIFLFIFILQNWRNTSTKLKRREAAGVHWYHWHYAVL